MSVPIIEDISASNYSETGWQQPESWSYLIVGCDVPAIAHTLHPYEKMRVRKLSGARSLTVTDTRLTFILRREPSYNSFGLRVLSCST